ncbi:putative uncharacterized protein [Anaerotruncus sp. CAG:390]|nr:putative uncharacterized protein [Anaerotruncus sp. CAG:390]
MIDKGTAELHQPLIYSLGIDGIGAVAVVNEQVLPLAKTDKSLLQRLGVSEVAHADGLFHILVAVYGTDAAAGRAELGVAESVLFKDVELLVIRQADRSAIADLEIFGGDGYSRLAETSDLTEEVLKVYDHTVAHDIDSALAKNARGEEVENKLSLVVHHSVSGVVAALITDDHVIVGGEQIDHTALALVAPVDAYDCC